MNRFNDKAVYCKYMGEENTNRSTKNVYKKLHLNHIRIVEKKSFSETDLMTDMMYVFVPSYKCTVMDENGNRVSVREIFSDIHENDRIMNITSDTEDTKPCDDDIPCGMKLRRIKCISEYHTGSKNACHYVIEAV